MSEIDLATLPIDIQLVEYATVDEKPAAKPEWERISLSMVVTIHACRCGEHHEGLGVLMVHERNGKGAERWSRAAGPVENFNGLPRKVKYLATAVQENCRVCWGGE